MSYNIVKWNCIVYYNNNKCIYVLKQKLSPKKNHVINISNNYDINEIPEKDCNIGWIPQNLIFSYILTNMNEQCASI